MRRLFPAAPATAALIGLALAGMALAGCGDDDESTPAACRDGALGYLAALADAPGEVMLDGEVPISDCLTENQGSGQLETVGETMIDAATQLNAEARSDPGGDANLEVGYLVGAAERGAAETSGIHAELIRRLTAAALYSPGGRGLPARFLSTYRGGVDAGREHG